MKDIVSNVYLIVVASYEGCNIINLVIAIETEDRISVSSSYVVDILRTEPIFVCVKAVFLLKNVYSRICVIHYQDIINNDCFIDVDETILKIGRKKKVLFCYGGYL